MRPRRSLQVLGIGQPLHALGAFDRPRHDRAGADAVLSPLQRQVLHHVLDAGLGGANVHLERMGHVGHAGRDEEDGALGLLELREGRPRGVEGADQVDVDHGLEAVGAQVLGAAQEVAGRAAHQHVDGAQRRLRLVDGRLQRRRSGARRRTWRTPCAPMRLQLLGGDVEAFARAAADGDVGPDRGEALGDAEVDAAAAARDEHGLARIQVLGEVLGDVHGGSLE